MKRTHDRGDAGTSSSSTVWRPRSQVAYVRSHLRVVIVDLDEPSTPPRILEGPAAAIWAELDGHLTLGEAISNVAQRFGVDSNEIAPQISQFVATLFEAGLLEPATRSKDVIGA